MVRYNKLIGLSRCRHAFTCSARVTKARRGADCQTGGRRPGAPVALIDDVSRGAHCAYAYPLSEQRGTKQLD